MVYIGIDTGTHTGFAVWDNSRNALVEVRTLSIHRAMDKVLLWSHICKEAGVDFKVIFEDARQRSETHHRWEKAQGAGSVKRDSSIWEDFLTDYGIPFSAEPPRRRATKVPDKVFRQYTGWEGRTSEHARDAALIVFNR